MGCEVKARFSRIGKILVRKRQTLVDEGVGLVIIDVSVS